MMDAKTTAPADLSTFLAATTSAAVARIIMAIADESVAVASLIRQGPLAGELGAVAGSNNGDGDLQKSLDLIADSRFLTALRRAGVAAIVSEEQDRIEVVDAAGGLLVAIDPLDGSSNIDTNVSIGTIFSVLPITADALAANAVQGLAGHTQRAAGFVIYGPQTALVFSTGEGTHLASLDTETGSYRVTRQALHVPTGSPEFAINASDYRHWHPPVQAYIDDCVEGADGPRGRNFNMRWSASLVADAYRIFARGGVFLYPADRRKGYERGRLRHLYEANPIAFLIEQAGGAATDGVNRILDLVPTGIHDRVPFVFGSMDKVERVRRYHLDPPTNADHSPLFGTRGLLRA